MPSSVSDGVRPMMASTLAYSSALSPNVAGERLVDHLVHAAIASTMPWNNGNPSVPPISGSTRSSGVRHEAEHAQVRRVYAGDGGGRSRSGSDPHNGMATSPSPSSRFQRCVIGKIVAVAMRHRRPEHFATLIVPAYGVSDRSTRSLHLATRIAARHCAATPPAAARPPSGSGTHCKYRARGRRFRRTP